MFLARNDQLMLVAQLGDVAPPAGLSDAADQLWKEQPKTSSGAKTIVEMASKLKPQTHVDQPPRWTIEGGACFEARLLSMHSNLLWLPLGIAMLEVAQSGQLLPIHHAHIEAICNALLDSGDVASVRC
jgi:hypothetical protein